MAYIHRSLLAASVAINNRDPRSFNFSIALHDTSMSICRTRNLIVSQMLGKLKTTNQISILCHKSSIEMKYEKVEGAHIAQQ